MQPSAGRFPPLGCLVLLGWANYVWREPPPAPPPPPAPRLSEGPWGVLEVEQTFSQKQLKLRVKYIPSSVRIFS